MSIQQYLDEMKEIQQNLLEFLDNESNDKKSYDDFFSILNNFKISEDKHTLASLLHLILKISTHRHRCNNFFTKIDGILLKLKDQIKTQFSNTEIFNIFKSSKRILLFLIESKMLIIDNYIYKTITSPKFVKFNYPQYFSPEIRSYQKAPIEKLDEDFYIKRKIGENDNYICQLIQNDSVQEFISYVNRSNISLESIIEPSIFETNPFLIKKKITNPQRTQCGFYQNSNIQINSKDNELTLIKYAAFYGSIQIFRYLQKNGVKLTQSLWPYIIHSNNAEMIHYLEDNHIDPYDKTYQKCFIESIKCHHNEFADYFKNNFLQNEKQNEILIQSLKSYNFSFIQYDNIDKSLFYHLCKYDHYILLKKNSFNDVGENEIILNNILYKFLSNSHWERKY